MLVGYTNWSIPGGGWAGGGWAEGGFSSVVDHVHSFCDFAAKCCLISLPQFAQSSGTVIARHIQRVSRSASAQCKVHSVSDFPVKQVRNRDLR